MFWNLGATFVLSVLKDAIKDPAKKQAIRSRMLEIASLIQTVFANDTDFQKIYRK